MCLPLLGIAQEKRTLTLEETIQLARKNSRSAKQAETQRNLGYWSFRVYKSQLKPQLLVRGTVPSYVNRATPITQPNGTISFRTVNQNNMNLSLGLSLSVCDRHSEIYRSSLHVWVAVRRAHLGHILLVAHARTFPTSTVGSSIRPPFTAQGA